MPPLEIGFDRFEENIWIVQQFWNRRRRSRNGTPEVYSWLRRLDYNALYSSVRPHFSNTNIDVDCHGPIVMVCGWDVLLTLLRNQIINTFESFFGNFLAKYRSL